MNNRMTHALLALNAIGIFCLAFRLQLPATPAVAAPTAYVGANGVPAIAGTNDSNSYVVVQNSVVYKLQVYPKLRVVEHVVLPR